MSGSGIVIEKTPVTLEDGRKVKRYRVMTEYRPEWFDETYVMGSIEPDEPQIGQVIEWLGEHIYFEDGVRRIDKIGYSWSADRK